MASQTPFNDTLQERQSFLTNSEGNHGPQKRHSDAVVGEQSKSKRSRRMPVASKVNKTEHFYNIYRELSKFFGDDGIASVLLGLVYDTPEYQPILTSLNRLPFSEVSREKDANGVVAFHLFKLFQSTAVIPGHVVFSEDGSARIVMSDAEKNETMNMIWKMFITSVATQGLSAYAKENGDVSELVNEVGASPASTSKANSVSPVSEQTVSCGRPMRPVPRKKAKRIPPNMAVVEQHNYLSPHTQLAQYEPYTHAQGSSTQSHNSAPSVAQPFNPQVNFNVAQQNGMMPQICYPLSSYSNPMTINQAPQQFPNEYNQRGVNQQQQQTLQAPQQQVALSNGQHAQQFNQLDGNNNLYGQMGMQQPLQMMPFQSASYFPASSSSQFAYPHQMQRQQQFVPQGPHQQQDANTFQFPKYF